MDTQSTDEILDALARAVVSGTIKEASEHSLDLSETLRALIYQSEQTARLARNALALLEHDGTQQ